MQAEIARTRYSTLFLAIEEATGQKRAIKVAHHDRKLFHERETAALAAIQSPYVIQLFDAGMTSDGRGFLATNFVAGSTVDKLVRAHGSLTYLQAIEILTDTCHALSAIHAAGFAHLDIKPANIMLEPYQNREKAVVVDLGLAKEFRAKEENTGIATASPAFAAPESLRAPGISQATCDLYSLGCLAYFLLTGQLPFEGRTEIEVAWKQIHEPPPALREKLAGRDYSSDLIEILQSCLNKEPADRPQRVSEIHNILKNSPC